MASWTEGVRKRTPPALIEEEDSVVQIGCGGEINPLGGDWKRQMGEAAFSQREKKKPPPIDPWIGQISL